MIVVTFAGRRAGGVLVFQLLKRALEHAGHPQAKLAPDVVDAKRDVNLVRRWTDRRLEELLEAARDRVVAIRTGAPPDRLTAGALFHALETGELKIVVVYRDPRSTVASLLHHNAGRLREIDDIDAALRALRADLRDLRHWGAFPSLKICHDDLRRDPSFHLQRITDDLGISVDVDAVVDEVIGSSSDTSQSGSEPDLSAPDRALVEAAVPNYLRLVELGDLSWFDRVG